MTQIRHVTGDATQPQGDGHKLIVHVCNDLGLWGAGFVLALSRRWLDPERSYRRRFEAKELKPGAIQVITVEPDISVVNMIAQRGVSRSRRTVRYQDLEICLASLVNVAREYEPLASVHMPRIGCGLGGGDWREIEPIIMRTLCISGIDVTVYDLPDPRTSLDAP